MKTRSDRYCGLERHLKTLLSGGNCFAELFIECRSSWRIIVSGCNVHTIQHAVKSGFGIRVFSSDGERYYYKTNPSPENIVHAIRQIRTHCLEPHDVAPVDESGSEEDYEASTIAEPVRIVSAAAESAWESDPKIHHVRGEYNETRCEVTVINTNGLYVSDRRLHHELYLESYAVHKKKKGRGIAWAGRAAAGHAYYDKALLRETGRLSAASACLMMDARTIKPGQYPAVIHSGWNGILWHEACGHGLEADFASNGSSVYADALGDKIASDTVTLVDDATYPGGRGSFAYDDEGTAAQTTTLIEKGILKSFLTDRKSSEKINYPLTGNARRESFLHTPLPRMTNTYMLPGNAAPDEMIRSVKKGLYIKKIGDGQADIAKGDFIFEIAEGYMIENGRLTFPITCMLVQGNGRDYMQAIAEVGNDLAVETGTGSCFKQGQRIPISVGQPTLKLQSIAVNVSQHSSMDI